MLSFCRFVNMLLVIIGHYRSLSVIIGHYRSFLAINMPRCHGNARKPTETNVFFTCMALKYDRRVVIPFRKNNAAHGKFAQNNSLLKLHRLLQSLNDTPYRCLATIVTPRQVGYDKCVLVPFGLHALIVPHYIDPFGVCRCDTVLLHRLAHGAECLDKL